MKSIMGRIITCRHVVRFGVTFVRPAVLTRQRRVRGCTVRWRYG
jgi:hypothetical protein